LIPAADKQTLGRGTAKLSNVLERCFVVLALFLFTGALLPLLLAQDQGSQDPVQGNPVSQVVFLGIYGITSLLIAVRWRRFIWVAARDKLLLLLIGVVLFSVFWSAAPAITLRQDVALLGTTLFGVYFVARYELREQLRLLAWAMGIAALLSLICALALPSYGIDSNDVRGDAWQGIYGGGKNILGRTMALSMMVFLLLALDKHGRHRWLLWAGFGLSAILLFQSHSTTPQVILLTILFLLPLYAALRWHYALGASFFVLAVLVGGGIATWLVADADLVLNALGRDLTLTNRTYLWPAVIEMIRERPWLGYGYGAFWLGWAGESAHVWLWNAQIGLEAEHAHNGYLDLCLNLGLLGASTFVLGFLLTARRAIVWARYTRKAEDLWPLAYLTFILLYNLTESAIIAPNDIIWLLYVVVVLWTATRLAGVRKKVRYGISPNGTTQL
jgi:exopolysaccharide production protein ExoQ